MINGFQDVCWSLYVGRDFSTPIPDLPMPPSTYGNLNAESQPDLLTMTFEATCQLLVISRHIMDVVFVSSQLFLPYKGTNVTMGSNRLSKQNARPNVNELVVSEIE